LNYRELLSYYKFDRFPRHVGNPYQVVVNNYEQFYTFLVKNQGINPIYTMHNTLNENGEVIYEQILFDLDGENAFNDLKELYRIFDDYEKVMSFSGSGFHLYLRVEPMVLPPQRIGVKEFESKLNLKSIDLISAEPKHIIRVPGSIYVKKGLNKKRYCIPINKDVFDLSYEELIKLSIKADISHIENNKGKKLYFNDDLIREEKEITLIKNEITSSGINWSEISEEGFKTLMKDVLDDNLYEMLLKPFPKHQYLFSSATKLRTFGYDLNDTLSIFDRISKNWDASFRNNKKELVYQLKQIYNRRYVYERF
jgi:hypothetical protein